jgi:hypothetical protein
VSWYLKAYGSRRWKANCKGGREGGEHREITAKKQKSDGKQGDKIEPFKTMQ